ncbi:MAG: hypothetical protein AB1427_01910 [Thermodesulfobacteriota bacterium]
MKIDDHFAVLTRDNSFDKDTPQMDLWQQKNAEGRSPSLLPKYLSRLNARLSNPLYFCDVFKSTVDNPSRF